MTKYRQFKAAAMHVAPVFLDTPRTVSKACALIREAADNGAKLVAFSETFVSAFPIWSAFGAPIHNHAWFRRLAASVVEVPGPEIARIRAAARDNDVMVSIGINEGSAASVGCIWNSNLLIGQDGAILNHHRKLVPTFWEKLSWANGDGAGLRVSDTDLGKVGMLICGENFNPLARFTMIAQGEQVHVSSYPPVWPAYDPKEIAYDVAEGIRVRANAHCLEAKVFNIVVSSFMDEAMIEDMAKDDPEARRVLMDSPRGVSMVMSPTGKVIAGPMQNEEGVLYADIDTEACVEPKQLHDLAGAYNRFDVFKLTVDRSANRPVRFEGVDDADDARRHDNAPLADDRGIVRESAWGAERLLNGAP
ncbi:carbon-nitrogen hydrolase family protein [Hansschlegelia zhihuaiae]|uniref:Carbon-nitrogen hydrolase family protein n=1 Tax=Hansschlegelia zhihuaiae TaxID=405005 RepID=A0A4Q0MGW8_9HYPH|nr:carbon-nitrogen hydrolase family protein [Hansschlegelia zhihuaiae]RXF72797.1 carbon-nitrogen hydrolase family protein [Hansschlegelia zhihuaiae]